MGGRIDGRVALVTGAGQGIGAGCAKALAEDGATVVLVGRTFAKVEQVASELESGGARTIAVEADVSDRAQVDAAFERVATELGRLDVLVNNAQDYEFRTIEETTFAELELAWRTGAVGTFNCMQAALPLLRERGGVVINMGTSSALVGEPRFASYAMAKEAIRALTRVAASEWGQWDIRVNCVCPTAATPGFIEWGKANPERYEQMARDRPLGRMGDPYEDIGRAIAALASDDMRYLTGATLMLNGGRVYLA